MSLFLWELGKIFSNARMWLVIAAAVIVNAVFLTVPEYGEYSPAEYNALWEEIETLPPNERGAYLSEKIIPPGEFFGESVLSVEFLAKQSLYNDVFDEIGQVDNYGEYLKSVDEAAENLKALSFFSDENGYDYRNILKTQNRFSELSSADLKHGKSKGVLLAARFGITDILLLVIILLIGAKAVSEERESGLTVLSRPTDKGRFHLAAAKLLAMLTAACTASVALYGSSFTTGAGLYGFGDMGRAIQSVSGLFSCGYHISVWEFLCALAVLKLLFCAVAAAAVYLFMSIPAGSIVGFAATGVFIVLSALTYFLITPTSYLSFLRQINIIALSDSESLVGEYLNINFFENPLNALFVTVAANIIFTAVCSFAGIALNCLFAPERRTSARKSIFNGRHTSIAAHEMYKCFVSGRGLVVIALCAAAVIILYQPEKQRYESASEYYYYSYIRELEGEVTSEKETFILNETASAATDFSEQGQEKITALAMLSKHTEYLKQNGGQYVADKGYKILTGDDSVFVYDRIMTAVKAAVFVLIISGCYCAEYKNGAYMLLLSSPNGRARTFVRKMLPAAACVLSVLLIFDGSRIYNVLNAWGMVQIGAPAESMEHLAGISHPIAAYLILTELGRFVGMMFAAVLIFGLSVKTKKYPVTVILSAVFFAMPPILSAVGFEFMDYFLLNPLLTGNVIIPNAI